MLGSVTVEGLNRKFTFDNFVVADCNRFAHTMAQQVVKNPGRSYNPVLIHSKAGLGKTHLMQAIGHAYKEVHPDGRLIYCSAENFLSAVVDAIRQNETAELRRKYRNTDLWLLDDIQFFWSKDAPASEGEFFHTLLHLLDRQKQVVMCSDVPPRNLPVANARLRDRMEGGVLVDLRMPEPETRVAILEKKLLVNVEDCGPVVIQSDILEYLARMVDSNVRVLEGILNKICAHQRLFGGDITHAFVDELAADYVITYDRVISPKEIVEYVSKKMSVGFGEMIRTNGKAYANWPRQVAIYVVSRLTILSRKEIGDFFGGRSGPTMSYSITQVEDRMKRDDKSRLEIERIIWELHERRP